MTFADVSTEDVFNGRDSKAARKVCPPDVLRVARRKLIQLAAVESLSDLRIPPGNRLEELRGSWTGFHSIRINDQFRVCFRWHEGGAVDVAIVDYH